MIDVCIISDARTKELEEVTQKGITSLLESGDDFSIYIVESNDSVYYPGTKVIYPNSSFGYNKYLNLAVKYGSSKYICLCNNDLIYEKDWAKNIVEEMKKDPELMSASPFCPQVHHANNGPNVQYGYTIKDKLCGWCIFQQRKIYDKIEKLDEDLLFWYSDNAYAMQLKKAKIKHGLVMNSVVNHHSNLLGATGMLLKGEDKKKFTSDQRRIFMSKYKTV